MKLLIKTLKSEHETILEEIKFLEDSKLVDEARLSSLFHFVEFTHHEKEEAILFPWMAKQNWLRQGGPLCGHFMSVRLDLNPLTRMHQHLEDFYIKHLYLPSYNKSFSWLNPQNPMSIPMEEHEMGHLLSQTLLYLIQTPQEAPKKDFFRTLLEDYFSLLRMHIHKEDNCLFVQCEQGWY